VKQESVRIASAEAPTAQRNAQGLAKTDSETPAPTRKVAVKDGSKYPAVKTFKLDLDSIPTWDPAGKPITEVDLDADIAEETKPWRVPGTDPTGDVLPSEIILASISYTVE